jgi:putative transposase
MDNVFIERVWRSLKHEEIYLKRYADGCEAKAGIAGWIYNEQRLRALGYRTPMAVWRAAATTSAVDMDNAVAQCDLVAGRSKTDQSRVFVSA